MPESEVKPLEIILATHNNYEMTAWCLKWLYASTELPFRLVVVDDSDDLTGSIFEDYNKRYGNIKVIRPEEKITSGNQIINTGIKNTEEDIVCFMTNNTIVEPQWINAALDFMKGNENIGCMGFKLLKPGGSIEHAGIAFFPGMAHHVNYGVGEGANRHTYFRDIGIVGWALVLLRRRAVPEGGFDEKTYHGFRGYDDIDNCLVMQQMGWKVIYCGMGSATHYALDTRGKIMGDAELKEVEDNRLIFTKKWGEAIAQGKPI